MYRWTEGGRRMLRAGPAHPGSARQRLRTSHLWAGLPETGSIHRCGGHRSTGGAARRRVPEAVKATSGATARPAAIRATSLAEIRSGKPVRTLGGHSPTVHVHWSYTSTSAVGAEIHHRGPGLVP